MSMTTLDEPRNRQERRARRKGERGIAIGMILMAVALVGVVVAAISTASRSSNTTASEQTVRTLASTVIQQGSNLKTGFDVMLSKGWSPGEVVFHGAPGLGGGSGGWAALLTNNAAAGFTQQIFHPTAGAGIQPPVPPANAMIATQAINNFHYRTGANPGGNLAMAITGIGTGSGTQVLVLPGLRQGVCRMVNHILYNDDPNTGTIPDAGAASTAIAGGTAATITGVATGGTPRSEGCVSASDGVFVYFKALAIN